MNFHKLSHVVDNDKVLLEYFENVVSPDTRDSAFQRTRSRGVLKPTDPIKQFISPTTINIVWITGMWSGIMPGTGNYALLLKPLGYDVKVVKTISDLKTAGLGRIARHLNWKWADNLHKRWADTHVTKNQTKVLEEMDDNPDIIIGSSQGGAIALSIAPKYQDVPMFLLCPAWKIIGVTPTFINDQSVIIHGIHDIEVPFADSEELAERFGVKLIPTNDGHIMQRGLSVLVSQLHSIADIILRTKNKKNMFHPQEATIWIS